MYLITVELFKVKYFFYKAKYFMEKNKIRPVATNIKMVLRHF